MIKNILVPLDGSEHAKGALEYALWMAERFGGALFGQHVIDMVSIEGTFFHDISGSLGFEPYIDISTKMREALEERGKTILEEFSRRCRERNIRCETFLDMGLVPNEICERAKAADLVVIGHRGINEEFSTGFLGGTAENVTRKSPRPVFVSTRAFRAIERPLLAYDASQRAGAAMESAAEFCARFKLPLTVLHIARDETLGQKALQTARSYLASYEIEARYELARGYPEQKIVDYLVNFGYDLLFIGAYGHRRIIELVIGSATEYVLRKSPRPVFLSR
ncbi:MAG TPA: universal stress protein [Candidatus Binatia bacterium]|jgi:nucleotide-binding universal stress UspA family protein